MESEIVEDDEGIESKLSLVDTWLELRWFW